MSLGARLIERYQALRALRDAIGLLWSETDQYAKRRLAIAMALVAATALSSAVAPIALKLVIDGFTEGAAAIAYVSPALLILAYVFSQFLAKTFGELRIIAHGQGEQRLHRRLSGRLFAHIMRLPLRYHLDRKSGAIGQTLATGLTGYQTLLQHTLYTFMPVAIEFVTIALVLAHLDRPIFVAILALTAISYLTVFIIGAARVAAPATAVSAAHIDAHALLTDSLLNYETVKYFNGESDVSRRYDGALSKTESGWSRLYRSRTANGLVIALIFGVSISASLLLAGQEVTKGTMTVGDFVLINTYMLRIAHPLEVVGFAVRDISQSLAFLKRMLEIFREAPEPGAASAATTRQATRGELTFERVTFGYRSDRPVLRDVTFSVPAARTVAIVGVSGAGKSSLVRLLFRLYDLNSGRILLDGEPTADMPLPVLRDAIAVVPQDTVLFNQSIRENIAFGRRDCTQADIENAARLAHLHDFVAGLPDGYDTLVGERGLKLSGGEKQRVAIARAALKKPRVFVFDEATSSLDTRTERQILRNLIEVSKGSTTLIVAHRLSTIVHADEILVLHEGSIVERGTHAALLECNGSYAALWKAQQNAKRSNGSGQSVSAA